MANNFALNTAGTPALTQVLVMTDDGLFDYIAQQATGKVAVSPAQARKLAAVRAIKHPSTGQPLLTES